MALVFWGVVVMPLTGYASGKEAKSYSIPARSNTAVLIRLTSAPVSAQAPTITSESPSYTGSQVKGDRRGGRGLEVRVRADGSAVFVCVDLTVVSSK